MPAALSSKRPPPRHDDLDNYNVDDLSDDPFASPTPPGSPKKRKEPDSTGIEEEVVQKRSRGPTVKLDEDRLLGPAGLSKLKARAQGLKLKGKGHEFSDASRLLSFYQLWLDDLFPKAKFVDALAMVEKVGHKKRVMAARNEFINQSQPKDRTGDDDDDLFGDDDGANPTAAESERPNVTTQPASTTGRPRTPAQDDDIPDDDDLYDVTPRTSRPPAAPAFPSHSHDIPDDDELEELMAEYGAPGESVVQPSRPPQPQRIIDDVPDDDDLDALVAEAEELDRRKQKELPVRSEPKDGPSEGANTAPPAQEEELEGLWD